MVPTYTISITKVRANCRCIFSYEVTTGNMSAVRKLKDFKVPGKYNKKAANQTARDVFWFYGSSVSNENSHGATFIVARGNPSPHLLHVMTAC